MIKDTHVTQKSLEYKQLCLTMAEESLWARNTEKSQLLSRQRQIQTSFQYQEYKQKVAIDTVGGHQGKQDTPSYLAALHQIS